MDFDLETSVFGGVWLRFQELQRFGQSFWGHFRRKKLQLPEGTMMPYGLQIVDTPGMIDMPVKSDMAGGRGYNFLEVVRWFAKRREAQGCELPHLF